MADCPSCKDSRSVEQDGYVVCTGCGLVLHDGILVPGAEWNDYSNDYWSHKYFQEVDNEQYKDICRTTQRILYMASEHECKFNKELKTISKHVLNLQENTVEMAMQLFTDFREHNLKRGENMRGIMAGSVYYACRMVKTPRPTDIIADAFTISKVKLHRCCNEMLDKLSDKPYHSQMIKESCSEDLLVRMIYLVDDIPVKWDVIKTCRNIIEKIQDNQVFRTQKPSKINATIIYIACLHLKINIPKQAIQRELNVSALTMINHEKMIQRMLQESQKN